VSDSPLFAYDRGRGVRFIAGADEVGRACLAGPVVAAGVLFDLQRLTPGAEELLDGLNDSKRVRSRAKRERLASAILDHAEAVAVAFIPASEIDEIRIDAATVTCLERALRAVGERAELRLVDGDLALGADGPAHELIVRGDGTSATIAAASIVAKVSRDRLMAGLSELYPGYGFERNAGYWTKEHVAAIEKHGKIAGCHRMTFNVRRLAEADGADRGVPACGRKSRRAPWLDWPPAEMAAHLLKTVTIPDYIWAKAPRLPRERRDAFIRRVLLGETGSR
jgi:ribonuclease HII